MGSHAKHAKISLKIKVTMPKHSQKFHFRFELATCDL